LEEAIEAPLTEDPTGQITALLQHWVQGDEKALRTMVPVVYKGTDFRSAMRRFERAFRIFT
jgi:hypothetical protein